MREPAAHPCPLVGLSQTDFASARIECPGFQRSRTGHAEQMQTGVASHTLRNK